MVKVIDLDSQGKDADGFVFTLTVGEARYGVTDQEVAELIRAKYANSKAGSKRPAPKKAQTAESAPGEGLSLGTSDADARTSPDAVDASH